MAGAMTYGGRWIRLVTSARGVTRNLPWGTASRCPAEYALAAGGECAMSEPHRTASSGAVPRPGWRSAGRLVA